MQRVYELIVTIADRTPGPDGDFSHDISRERVEQHIELARRDGALLLLDLQPGRTGFLDVAKRWEWALRDPWVGLALDPEWRMGRRQVPGRVVGSVDAREVNRTSAWLADLVREADLPEKLFVLHQFRTSMIRRIGEVRQRPGFAEVQHVDGFGTPAQKRATYAVVARPSAFTTGFKIFYDEDVRRMSPSQVLAVRPRVRFVSFQQDGGRPVWTRGSPHGEAVRPVGRVRDADGMRPDAGPSPAAPGVSRPQRLLRLVGILAALTAELAVVLGAYQLDDAAQQRRLEVARVQALSDTLQAGAAARVVRPVLLDAVGDLRRVDTPGSGAIRRAATGPGLGTDRGRAALSAATQRSAGLVDAQLETRNRQAWAVVLGLFLVVCIGWFVWFARLARRHRDMQSRLTRHEVERDGERRLQALVHSGADVIAVLEPDTTILFISPAAATVLGRAPELLLGRRFASLVTGEDRQVLTGVLARTDGVERAVSLQVPHPDGRLLTLDGTLTDRRDDPAVQGWVMTVRDVSDRDALEQDLAHQAFHDSLTGLANRRLLGDRLQHALLGREHSRHPLAMLCIDLDDFKTINDSLGHDVGDEVLVVVAQRLAGELQPGDTAARLGADEFVVLLDDCDLDQATQVAHRLLGALADPVELDGEAHRVSSSIGLVALAQGAEADPHLLRNADVAMHAAKDRGKNGLAVYDDQMHLRMLAELQTQAELTEAISHGDLVLHFQPTVWLQTGTISGFEALVRWPHPERGMVPPSEFIGLAESSGLIVPLGGWVLAEACRAAASMQTKDGGPTMAVNVAPRQLAHPDFRASVLEALEASGLPPHRLVLEITETVLLDDAEEGLAVLAELRELGLRVAIDDFGTGYNSLAQLSALPLDVLKIDKSFVDKLGGDTADSSLVDAIIGMGQAMGLLTLAEGVEHVDQARWLREHDVMLGQGYLWSRPVPLSAARELLHTGLPVVMGAPVPIDRPA